MPFLYGDDCTEGFWFTIGGLGMLMIHAMGGPLIKILPKDVYMGLGVLSTGYGIYELMKDPECISSLTGGNIPSPIFNKNK